MLLCSFHLHLLSCAPILVGAVDAIAYYSSIEQYCASQVDCLRREKNCMDMNGTEGITQQSNDDKSINSGNTRGTDSIVMKHASSSPPRKLGEISKSPNSTRGTDNILKHASTSPGKLSGISKSPTSTTPNRLQTQKQTPQHQGQLMQPLQLNSAGRKQFTRRSSAKLSVQPISLLNAGSIDDTDRSDIRLERLDSRLDKSGHSVGTINRKLQRSSHGTVLTDQKARGSNPLGVSGIDSNISMHSNKSASSTFVSKLHPSVFEQPKVPRMKDPSRCNLFCAFYAEFDNIVGPKVTYQSPQYFMDHDIATTTKEVEQLLAKSFRCSKEPENAADEKIKSNVSTESANNAQTSPKATNNVEGGQGDDSAKDEVANDEKKETRTGSHAPTVSASQAQQVDTAQKPTVPQHSQSIFDATCEYIITGNELTGQIISLSTHNVHIIARPTIIQDARYERNSLLFSVGFVIRRLADPSPYRPLLSRLASVLRSMEVESRFLSSPSTKPRIQQFLDTIVPSLNSPGAKCHLLLDEANALHLQYFPPPKEHAPPVPKFVVPVLLRPEHMLQSLDWDLTINWIVPHINGIKHAKLIAESSKVDEAMVLSCLRVLRHHNVLACVDIFRYSNIYESTPKAQQMLAGKMDGLLHEAFQFISKQTQAANYSVTSASIAPGTPVGSSGNVASSVKNSKSVRVGNTLNGGGTRTLLAPIGTPSSYPPIHYESESAERPGTPTSSSFTYGRGIYMSGTMSPPPLADSKESSSTINQSLHYASPVSTSVQAVHLSSRIKKEQESMKTALSVLFSSCERGVTLGEVFTNRVKSDEGPRMEEAAGGTSNGGLRGKASKKKNKKSKTRSSSTSSNKSSDAVGSIDWKEAFNLFDHRRFVTFGVIHGLIRRIHEFPIAIKSEIREEPPVPESRPAVKIVVRIPDAIRRTGRRSLRRYKSLGLEGLKGNGDPLPPFKMLNAPTLLRGLSNDFSTGSLVRVQNQEDAMQRHSSHSLSSAVTPICSHTTQGLLKKITIAMDGSRCDDELSCMFQKPINELKELVKKDGKSEVISMYSSEI